MTSATTASRNTPSTSPPARLRRIMSRPVPGTTVPASVAAIARPNVRRLCRVTLVRRVTLRRGTGAHRHPGGRVVRGPAAAGARGRGCASPGGCGVGPAARCLRRRVRVPERRPHRACARGRPSLPGRCGGPRRRGWHRVGWGVRVRLRPLGRRGCGCVRWASGAVAAAGGVGDAVASAGGVGVRCGRWGVGGGCGRWGVGDALASARDLRELVASAGGALPGWRGSPSARLRGRDRALGARGRRRPSLRGRRRAWRSTGGSGGRVVMGPGAGRSAARRRARWETAGAAGSDRLVVDVGRRAVRTPTTEGAWGWTRRTGRPPIGGRGVPPVSPLRSSAPGPGGRAWPVGVGRAGPGRRSGGVPNEP